MTTPGQDSRGTAALRQAIATGAPVPTTGEQAKELNTPAPSQRWGVWYEEPNGNGGWCVEDRRGNPHLFDTKEEAESQPAITHPKIGVKVTFEVRPYPSPTPKRDVHDPMMREISYEQAIDILTKQGGDTREVVLVSPTPPAKVEGEWKRAGNGPGFCTAILTNGSNSVCVDEEEVAPVLALLNSATTLAAENARLREALSEDAIVEHVLQSLESVGCMYRTVGEAMYEEPAKRLAFMVAARVRGGAK